jgi:hypothetical protein
VHVVDEDGSDINHGPKGDASHAEHRLRVDEALDYRDKDRLSAAEARIVRLVGDGDAERSRLRAPGPPKRDPE